MAIVFKKNEEKSLPELGGCSGILVFAIGWKNSAKEGLFNKLAGKRHEADLDLSCVTYDAHDERIDCVWYAQLQSKDGAIRHKGDDTVGWDAGDDEAVTIDLSKLNDQVKTLFFVISSFSEESFSHVDEAYWRLFDGQGKRVLGGYKFKGGDRVKARIVMRLQKTEVNGLNEWRVKCLDEAATGQNVQEIFPEIRALLAA